MLDELGGFDEGFRLYGEDIDLCYRAARAGWERWYVPAAVVEHEHTAETDRRFLTRRTLWHWRGHPALRPQASRAAARAVSRSAVTGVRLTKYDAARAERCSRHEYADPSATTAAARAPSSSTGRGSQAGDTLLDLACGDGGSAVAPARRTASTTAASTRARRWSRRAALRSATAAGSSRAT